MDSANQGQSWKPKITPKFKLGKNGNLDLDTISMMATTFKEILDNFNNSYRVTKLAQKGLDIYNEWMEA